MKGKSDEALNRKIKAVRQTASTRFVYFDMHATPAMRIHPQSNVTISNIRYLAILKIRRPGGIYNIIQQKP